MSCKFRCASTISKKLFVFGGDREGEESCVRAERDRVWGRASRSGKERNIVRCSREYVVEEARAGPLGFCREDVVAEARSAPMGYCREEQLPSQEPSQEPGLKVQVERTSCREGRPGAETCKRQHVADPGELPGGNRYGVLRIFRRG